MKSVWAREYWVWKADKGRSRMPQPKNAMEIFQLLDKSNCRECGEKTCLAFAGAVYQGHKKIDRCPKLNQATIDRFSEVVS